MGRLRVTCKLTTKDLKSIKGEVEASKTSDVVLVKLSYAYSSYNLVIPRGSKSFLHLQKVSEKDKVSGFIGVIYQWIISRRVGA